MDAGPADVHSHLFPRWYLDRLRTRHAAPMVTVDEHGERFFLLDQERETGGRPLTESFWEIEPKLGFMDDAGITQTVLTMGNPWMHPFEEGESAALADRLNEEFSGLESRTGGRICGVGVFPNGSIDAAVAVVRAIGSEPGLRGIVAGGRICGRPFDDPSLEPVWGALEDAGVPLFLHPRCGAALDELGGYGSMLPVAVGFPMETTIALSRLLFGGALQRHSGLRLIAAHGGGAISLLAARIDALWRAAPPLRAQIPSLPSETLRRLYADALLYDPGPMTLVAGVVGPDHVLFGTDHPYDIADPPRIIQAIRSGIDPEHHDAVLGATARTLLRLPTPSA